MARPPPRPRILVLDDDQPFLQLMRETLEDVAAYTAEIPAPGEDWCQAVKQRRPDLVILDVVIAGVDLGWSILERLKRDPETRLIPIIVCTALFDAERGHEALLRQEAVRFVPKPFDLDQILEAIATMLSQRGSEGAAPRKRSLSR